MFLIFLFGFILSAICKFLILVGFILSVISKFLILVSFILSKFIILVCFHLSVNLKFLTRIAECFDLIVEEIIDNKRILFFWRLSFMMIDLIQILFLPELIQVDHNSFQRLFVLMSLYSLSTHYRHTGITAFCNALCNALCNAI